MLMIPRRILSTPLMRRGGYQVVPKLFAPEIVAALKQEAVSQQSLACETRVRQSDTESVRGGDPARKFLNAPGGDLQTALYLGKVLPQALAGIVGLPLVPTGPAGTFTYYCREGDFLTIHRDIVACDVALITCLDEQGIRSSGGKLCVYPGRIWEYLSSLRRDPVRGAVAMRLEPGESIILLGGVVPHCTLPVTAGQRRIVSLLCYRAVISK